MFFIIPIIFFIIFIVVIVSVVRAFSKHTSNLKNLIDNDGVNSLKDLIDSDSINNFKNAVSKMNDSIIEATTTTCEYCGGKCEKTEDKCPNCGAGINNK